MDFDFDFDLDLDLDLDLGLGLDVDLDLKFRIQNFENHVVKRLWFASKNKKSFGHLKF